MLKKSLLLVFLAAVLLAQPATAAPAPQADRPLSPGDIVAFVVELLGLDGLLTESQSDERPAAFVEAQEAEGAAQDGPAQGVTDDCGGTCPAIFPGFEPIG